ncbi:hypothetical protein [Cupriavidus neocaledonicus]|uniref:Uncharacterized protein n=1 Tax=Cupriavidus neocaledonicus TaxID=1040979 RepID=A0A375H9F2_9BURK|nr:hypothetical protein [Cupriavidus neocaledonicus]SPD47508.1 protein of unknown function [Cupriavidus neocaledonicus]
MKHLTTQTLDSEAGCILSDCEQYRYRLWREWDRSRPGLGWAGLGWAGQHPLYIAANTQPARFTGENL